MESSNQAIGARVRKLRKRNKLTQERLASLIGTSRKHISAIERGTSGMSIDIQVGLRNVFHCSIDYLIMGSEFESIDSILSENVRNLLLSNDEREKKLFIDYISMYQKIRNSK